ncbi:MAG: AAA family ATPase [Gemmatimonas sp.]
MTDRRPRSTSTKGSSPSENGDAIPQIRIHAFGACTVEIAGARLGRNADVVARLILLLAHAPGHQMARDRVLQMLWPDSSEKHQRGNVRQALYKLRQMGIGATLNGDQIELDGVHFEPTFSMRRDPQSFDMQVVRGHEPFGPFLPGFDVSDNDLFAEWLENERERAAGDARRVLSTALRARHAVADWVAAEPLARWLLQFDPLNEAATLVMAECLVLSGAKYEAIRLLDRYMNELGPNAGDLRIPATTLRRRIAAPAQRRISFAPTERHFIGRESAMADLTLCMRRARHHDGTATLLHGTAGIGKTRVLHELSKVALIEGVRDVRASCRETDVSRPLSIFLDLVPDLLHMPGALGCTPESLQALRRFVNDESVQHERAAGIAQMPLAASLRRSIIDLIGATSEEKQMLLTIEDVHWLDAGSWEVLVDLIDRLDKMRVCLIMTSRQPHARPTPPERVPIDLKIRALEPLTGASTLHLAQLISDDLSASFDEELGQWFVHSSEGVPLFLRSLVNHWIETGDAGGIPPTLLGVINQRLQSLSADALHVLQTVALLGRHAELGMIESVLELPYFRIVSAIDDLHKAGAFDGDNDGVLVCHELIGRMAVDNLGRNARRALHKRIADLMRSIETKDGITPVLCRERLSHLLLTGDKKLYGTGVCQAIRSLVDSGFAYDALGVADASMQHISDEDDRRRIQILQSEALYSSGEFARLLKHPLSPSSLAAGLSRWSSDDPDSIVRWIDSAAYADRSSNAAELAAAACLLAESPRYPVSMRFKSAMLAIRIASNAADAEVARRSYLAGLSVLAEAKAPPGSENEIEMLYHTSFGDISTGLASATRCHQQSLQIASATERLSIQMRVAFAYKSCGDTAGAKALLEAICRDAEREELSPSYALAMWRLSSIELEAGNVDRADHWLTRFCLVAPVDREPLASSLVHWQNAKVALKRGDLPRAEYHRRVAYAELPEDGHVMRHAASLVIDLGIARLRGDSQAIEALIVKSLPIYLRARTSLGQSSFAAELSTCLSIVGRADDGRELLQEYITLCRREPGPFSHDLIQAAQLLELRTVHA